MAVLMRLISLILIVIALLLLGADAVSSLERGGELVVRSLGNAQGALPFSVLVGASGQVALMDVADHLRLSQAEQLVVAFDVLVKVFEALAPVLGLRQPEALDHGAHGAVKDEQALAQQLGQGLGAGIGWSRHGRDCR